MGNVIVAQSGGPTVAINASLAGVIKGAMDNKVDKIYGSINGIKGIMNDNVIELSQIAKADSDFIEKLKLTPAMYLGSCRFKLPALDEDTSVFDKLFEQFAKYEIEAFFYIGGNDSMDTVAKLSAYAKKINSKIKFLGIPKTIDNDLCVTDHTPGFGSAAKYIATTVMETIYDAKIYNNKSVTIIEIMGRDAGWLTAASALAKNDYCDGPDLIYLPEVAFDKNKFLDDLRLLLDKKTNIIVAISEGIHDAAGNYISATSATNDQFGHAQLSGAGKALEMLVKSELEVKCRSIEINVLQRAAAHLCSLTDIEESFSEGEYAVKSAMDDATACMVTLTRINQDPYKVQLGLSNIDGIANLAKEVPKKWINEKGNGVTKEMIEYLTPLIQGEPKREYKNGLPVYVTR